MSDLLKDPVMNRRIELLAKYKILHLMKKGVLKLTGKPASTNGICPSMDVLDIPTLPTIAAIFELPGVDVGDINLTVHDGWLRLTTVRLPPPLPSLRQYLSEMGSTDEADRTANTSAYFKNLTTHELEFGRIVRHVRLPPGVTRDDIRIHGEHGMLLVQWPRVVHDQDATDDVYHCAQ